MTAYNGVSIVGFICSVISLFFIPIPLAITGIVFSVAGYIQGRNYSNTDKGFGIAGVIIGGSSLIYRIVLLVLTSMLSNMITL